jgi:peptidoglycan lytic transglycosylase G
MTETHTDTEPLPTEEPPVTDREARSIGVSTRHRRWPRVLGAVAVLLVLLAAGGYWWVIRQIDPPGDPGPEVQITIAEGTGTSRIADLLAEEGIITNATVFRFYVQFEGTGTWQAGVYTLREDSAMGDVIDVLDAGPAAAPFDQVTVPEGYSVFARAGVPAPGRLVQRLVDPDQGVARFRQNRIMRLLLGGELRSQYQPTDVTNLEGLLFPDTYRVEADENERALLTRMIQRFDQIAGEAGLDDATARVRRSTGGALRLTPYQVVIVASLIEREAQVPEERPMMARVIYNRLADGTVLGIDASLNYALGHPATTESELATNSPYNLREVAGLPPTPIAVPGRASLEAALAPARGEWRYYVLADDAGRHTFTNTYEEFLDAKAECQAQGLC